MAYSVTKQPDGDLSLGSVNGEIVTLQPAPSDYPTGGYALVDGVSVVNNSALNQNIDLYRLLAAVPILQNGYVVEFNPTTKKVLVYQQNGSTGVLVQPAANTDLSAFSFGLLLIGV